VGKRYSENQLAFQKLFAAQMLNELDYLDDVAKDRAQPRAGFNDKVFGLVRTALGPLDELGIGDIIGDSVEFAIGKIKDCCMDTDTKVIKALSMLHQHKREHLENSITECSTRLSIQLASIVGRLEPDSVPVFAHGCVLRILDHFLHKELRSTDIHLPNMMLHGVIKGSSGAFIDGFQNIALEVKDFYRVVDPKSVNKVEKFLHHHAFTVEGVGRSGFVVANADGSNQYLSNEYLLRGNFPDKVSTVFRGVSKRFTSAGKLDALKALPKELREASSNYTKLDHKNNIKYGFIQLTNVTSSPHTLYKYDESIGLTKGDQKAHKEAVGDARLVVVSQKLLQDYLTTNQDKPQSLNDYVNGIALIKPSIKWQDLDNLNGADLSDALISRAHFSNVTLDGINFSGASLVEADFSHSSITNCNFNNAKLGSSNFRKAKLKDTDLSSANCNATNFRHAEFTHVQYLGSTWTGAQTAGLKIHDAVKAEFDSYRKQIEKWRSLQRKKLKQLTNSLGLVEEKLAQLSSQADEQKGELETYGSELAELRDKIADVLDSYTNEFDSLHEISKSVDMKYDAYIMALQSDCLVMQSDIDDLNSRYHDLARQQAAIAGQQDYISDTYKLIHEHWNKMSSSSDSSSSPTSSPRKSEAALEMPNWRLPVQAKDYISSAGSGVIHAPKKGQPTETVEVTGKAKIGKTAFANNLCHQWLKENPNTRVIWLDGKDPVKLENDYYDFASSIEKPMGRSRAAVINAFNERLSARGDWVIVIDGVSDQFDYQKIIPARGGTVIVTTASPSHTVKQQQIQELSEENAKHLIRQTLTHQEIPEARINTVYSLCGGWPGPIKDICHHLNRFSNLQAGLDSLRSSLSTESSSVANSSLKSISEQFNEKLETLDPASIMLMKRMKFYSSKNIPLALLADNFDLSQSTIRQLLPDLIEKGLIEVNKSDQGELVSINPIYQSTLQNSELVSIDNYKDFLEAIKRTLSHYSNHLDPKLTAFTNDSLQWQHMHTLSDVYKEMRTEIEMFMNSEPHYQSARYELMLLNGYLARHHYERGELEQAFEYTRETLQLVSGFNNNDIATLFLKSDSSWAKERFDFMQKALTEIFKQTRGQDDTKSIIQHRTAKELLKFAGEINNRLGEMMTIKLKHQQTSHRRETRLKRLDLLISDYEKKFRKSADKEKKSYAFSLSDKQNVEQSYENLLSEATSVEELDELYNALKERDTLLKQDVTMNLGLKIKAPGFMKKMPGISISDKLEKFVEKQREKLITNGNSPPTKRG